MKKLLFFALTATACTFASCTEQKTDTPMEGTSDGSINDGTVDANLDNTDTTGTGGAMSTSPDSTTTTP